MGRDGYACPRNGAGTNMPSHQRSLIIIQYCAVNVVRFLEGMDAHWIWIPTLLFERLPILWASFAQGCFLKMRLCDSAESLAAMPECFFAKDENSPSNCMRLCGCNYVHTGRLLALTRGAAQDLLAFFEHQSLRVLDDSLVPSLRDRALFAAT